MAATTPIFRIFDYEKVKEFYIDCLGFQIDWEDKPGGAPIYLQIPLQGIVLHLSELKFMNPGIGKTPWDSKTLCMEVTDPFENRLTFTGNE